MPSKDLSARIAKANNYGVSTHLLALATGDFAAFFLVQASEQSFVLIFDVHGKRTESN